MAGSGVKSAAILNNAATRISDLFNITVVFLSVHFQKYLNML
jgi:hypothetical protein